MQARELMKKALFDNKVHDFYRKLRENQIKIIDQGHNIRFDKVYAHLFNPADDHTQHGTGSKELLIVNQPELDNLTEEER